MKRFDERSEFVQSVIQALVALIATSVGMVAAGTHIWVNVWFGQLAKKRNIPPLEIFTLGFESLLICVAITVMMAAKLYRLMGASQNETLIRRNGFDFAVGTRIFAGVLSVVMCLSEIALFEHLKPSMIARLLVIFIVFVPLHTHRGLTCVR